MIQSFSYSIRSKPLYLPLLLTSAGYRSGATSKNLFEMIQGHAGHRALNDVDMKGTYSN